jgi:hypothetical protein
MQETLCRYPAFQTALALYQFALSAALTMEILEAQSASLPHSISVKPYRMIA